MRRCILVILAGVFLTVAAVLWYASRLTVSVIDNTLLWASEYDAARQTTIFPGQGNPLAQLKAGDRFRVLWTVYGKDYRAHLVVAAHWQRGWVLSGQHGLPHIAENTSVPNEAASPNRGPRFAFAMSRKFGYCLCVPPSLSGGGRYASLALIARTDL
jgi:hypothetical protein